jgi:hypothetical protein
MQHSATRSRRNVDEKEFKSKRKEIQENLIKFATRIPVFMYLTDYREYSLEDVITQLEPKLFIERLLGRLTRVQRDFCAEPNAFI